MRENAAKLALGEPLPLFAVAKRGGAWSPQIAVRERLAEYTVLAVPAGGHVQVLDVKGRLAPHSATSETWSIRRKRAQPL